MADEYADFGGDTAPVYADLGGDTATNTTQQYDSNGIPLDSSGNYVTDDQVGSSVDAASINSFVQANPEYKGFFDSLNLGNIGQTAWNTVKGLISDSKGNISGAKIAALGGGIAGLLGSGSSFFQTQQKPVGYTGGIPQYTGVREAVPNTYDPTRRPGSRGQEYFTNMQYAKPDQVATAQAQAAQDAQAAETRNKARQAEFKAAPPRQDYAAGGLANLAQGRYLSGATDGMADKIPATIANQQPAKLSHGEFVVPADVVSHLGNGNSEAGANRLYGMMDKVRKARTGTTKQGKQINPNKFMPG